MYVSSVIIENIRGFRGGERRVRTSLQRPNGSFAGWTVLAGRNGSGKSTFLRSIALALAGPTAARTLVESFQGWIRNGHSSGMVRVEIRPTTAEDRFQGMGKLPKDGFDATLTWRASGAGSEPTLVADPAAAKVLRGPWRGPWADNFRGWFVAGYGPFRRLTGHASDAQRLMVAPNHSGRLVSLFREDASLVECVQWLRNVYLQRLEKREGAAELEQAVIDILNDGLLPDGTIVKEITSEGLWVRQGGTELPLRELSDGYRVMVALVLDIARQMHDCYGHLPITRHASHVTIDMPGVVLIDEIDAHLHVSWQQRIGFWLKERFPKIQFIVSTHSPFICQAADAKGLIRLPAPGERSVAEHVSADIFRKVVHGTADQAVLSALFGLEHTRSEATELLRKDLAALRAKQLQGKATEADRRRISALQLTLPFEPVNEVESVLQEVKEMLDKSPQSRKKES